jgi:hypothetical protein
MQALIDFDGWRKWEDFATENGLKDPRDIKTGPRASATRRREAKPPPPPPPTNNSTANLAHIAAGNATASLPHTATNTSSTNDASPMANSSMNGSVLAPAANPSETSPTSPLRETSLMPVPAKSIADTLNSGLEDHQAKEDSPDTIVNVAGTGTGGS